MDRHVDERLLLIDVGDDPHVAGERGLELLEGPQNLVGQGPRIAAGLFRDGEHDRGPAIDGRVAPLDLLPFDNAGHLAQQDRPLGRWFHDDLR